MTVSSEFSQSDSAADADYLDLVAYQSLVRVGRRSAAVEYMRRLDARAVLAGQLSAEEFRDVWEGNPHQIVADCSGVGGASSLYGGEIASESAQPHNQTGTPMTNRPRVYPRG